MVESYLVSVGVLPCVSRQAISGYIFLEASVVLCCVAFRGVHILNIVLIPVQ